MIREDFIQYLWGAHLIPTAPLELSTGEVLDILSYGEVNPYGGPDFFNARLRIGSLQWAGYVEVHTASSLWYAHHHEQDPAYGNVILHVVWEHDVEVFDFQQNIIPTLELKSLISNDLVEKYTHLQQSQASFISCEKEIPFIHNKVIANWLDKLYTERLKEKAQPIFELLQQTQQDWEAVFFLRLLSSFGGNINGEAFWEAGKQLPFSVIRKQMHDLTQLEALLMGQLRLLEATDINCPYYRSLQQEYQYLMHKYTLPPALFKVQFAKLRPPNFPTIRLAQIAALYHEELSLFDRCMSLDSYEQALDLFAKITPSSYWKNHFSFGKESKESSKRITPAQIANLWINTIVPMQYAFAHSRGKDALADCKAKMRATSPEHNSILERWEKLLLPNTNALESQAILQLYKKYCNKHACMACQVGQALLKK
jgi:hypothetical protein